MYEPIHLPSLIYGSNLLKDVKFDIRHTAERMSSDTPELDPIHIHPYVEILFNINSHISFLVENRVYPLGNGDVIISRPQDTHVCIFESDRTHEYVCLWVDAPKDSPLLEFLASDAFSPCVPLGDNANKMRKLLLQLERCAESDKDELPRAIALLGIFNMLNDASMEMKSAKAPIPQSLQIILDDIHENYADIHSVNDIIARHFISSATLTRYFRTYIHCSPKEYLESKKLSNAARLLINGESVTGCCMKCGFNDCSHFISLFKKRFGTTPFKYKKARPQ